MKVVLDSNVVIAAFASRGLCSDVFELCLYEHSVVLSRSLLQEIHRGLRNKVKLPQSLADSIRRFLSSEAEIVTPARVPKDSCRDPSDNKVLGTAVASKADAIITGDEDLLVLRQFRSIPILSPREFWSFVQTKIRRERKSR